MIEKHSTTGRRLGNDEQMHEYEHISIRPCSDNTSSCNSCGRPNYEKNAKDKIKPTGLQLFELLINPNGYQAQMIRLCPDCIKDLRSKLFQFSA